MVTKKQLQNAVQEFNEVMGLNPPLDTNGSIKDLTDRVKEAITYINSELDVFGDATTAVINEFKGDNEEEDTPETLPEEDVVPEETPLEEEEEETPEEPTTDYVDQDKEESPKTLYSNTLLSAAKTEKAKRKSEVEYFERSAVVKGLVIGSKVQFVTVPNSGMAPKQKLTGTVSQIKMHRKKTPNEVVQIQTKIGMFYKATKSVALIK